MVNALSYIRLMMTEGMYELNIKSLGGSSVSTIINCPRWGKGSLATNNNGVF